MMTYVCHDCCRLMQKREEIMEDNHRIFWICESCGKKKHSDNEQLKIN